MIFLCVLTVFAQEAGNFTSVHNQVTHNKAQAKVPNPVFVMDTVKTEAEARARITLLDKSKLDIAPKSNIVIEDYMIKQGTTIHLLDGVPEFEGKNTTIKTSTAIAGIRG